MYDRLEVVRWGALVALYAISLSVALGGAVYLFHTIVQSPEEHAHLIVFGLPILFVLAAPVWAPLAALVSLVRPLVLRGAPPRVLRPIPVPSLASAPRLRRVWNEVAAWIRRRRSRLIVLPLVAVVFIQLILFSFARPTGPFEVAAPIAFFQFVAAGSVVGALGLTLEALRGALNRLTDALQRLRNERWARAHLDLDRVREALGEGRHRASGRVEAAGAVIAPLSGRRCVAFRLRGRAGDLELDDADVAPFSLRGEDLVDVRAKSYVAALPEPDVAPLTPSPEQRARLAAFFEQRSLPFDPDRVELGESLLEEGELASAYGAERAELAPAGGGYRSAGIRRVLDDADGQPVLVTRAAS